ncbi:Cardiolipin synthase, ClsA [hydrothermal vent metagenome]|uniref:Cardiolipin synthase, ClsA n=1 Tax=hydrothermal vent metagenome TaxID=652676 RepID=A0A3B0UJL5_9ZZZZ
MGIFDNFLQNWLQLVSLVFLITSVAIAVIIVMEKRSPFKTIAWILALVLLPIIGLIFYLFLGQEYRKRKLWSRRGIKDLERIRELTSRQLRRINRDQLETGGDILEKEKIISLLLNNSHSLLTTGNEVKLLNNGEATFKAILNAIDKACHHIHLEYYIIDDDEIGNQLKRELIKKSREGVEVRVIIDDVGSWSLSKKYIKELRDAGVELYPFMEVRFPRLTSRLNYRNHRKIVVIDGEVGFTGGINLADRYKTGNKKVGLWRDTHIQITGDAVSCLQVIFAADWFFVKKENLAGDKYFKPFSEAPGVPVQITSSGPDSDWKSIEQAYFTAIAGAKQHVYITTPYLIPPQDIVSALKTAALGNIDVRIIIPERSDARVSKWCSFSFVNELLEAGVKVYFYKKGFIHSKILIVDSILSSVGTTNLDFRSFETNFEINAFIYDKEFTERMILQFNIDLENSMEIVLEEWSQRSWINKLRESLAHIVSPML